MHATQGQLVEFLRTRCALDEFDLEDAEALIAVLSEGMTAMEIMTWLAWPDTELEGVPVELIKEGRFREVLMRGRNLVAVRSS
jgi:hypothetical protein